MLGKRNPHTPLVGMQITATTMENSMEAPQKTKSRMKTTFTKTKMKQF
jgi:hypothetical protein